jgi:hypothetical protein
VLQIGNKCRIREHGFAQESVGLWNCVNALTKIRFPHKKTCYTLEGLTYIQVILELFMKILRTPVK